VAAPGGQNAAASITFWRRIARLAKVAIVVTLGLGVWLIGFSSDEQTAPVLPDTNVQFSLDLAVIDTVDHDLIYAVEQRARPYYRIFSLDPKSGDVQTIFTVPDGNAIIYGIALDPTGNTLAVSYTPDFELGGSGIWTLDVATQEMARVLPVTDGVFLTDISWAPDGNSVLVNHVDRRGADEELSIARISLSSESITLLVADAINPIQIDETLYYLNVDENLARRSIGSIDPTGAATTIDVDDGRHDLDHLLPGIGNATLRVAILEATDDAGVTLGEPASAHGSHDVPSTWWAVTAESELTPTGLEPSIVYDAAANNDTIAYATNEGLSVGTTTRIDLIRSRAIRFVTS